MKIFKNKFFLLTTFISILLLVLSCSTNDKTNILAEQQIESISRIVLIEPGKSPSYRYITDLNTISSQPKWSPDKKTFAFISMKDNLKDLWISDEDGIYSKVNNDNLMDVQSFEWSPNSKEIAI
jgi:Tol biopolymer transport system component